MSKELPPLTPSPEARQLFNALVPAAEDGVVSRANFLVLSTVRAQRGLRDKEQVEELIHEKWIKPTRGGDLRISL